MPAAGCWQQEKEESLLHVSTHSGDTGIFPPPAVATAIFTGLDLISWMEETKELVPLPPLSGPHGMLQLGMMGRQKHGSNDPD